MAIKVSRDEQQAILRAMRKHYRRTVPARIMQYVHAYRVEPHWIHVKLRTTQKHIPGEFWIDARNLSKLEVTTDDPTKPKRKKKAPTKEKSKDENQEEQVRKVPARKPKQAGQGKQKASGKRQGRSNGKPRKSKDGQQREKGGAKK